MPTPGSPQHAFATPGGDASGALDPVTGVARFGANEPALHRLLQTSRAGGLRVALLHIDIDRFRSINESVDTETGDHALALIAQQLRDRLDAGAELWRLADDEFIVAVALPDATSDPVALAEQLRARVQLPLTLPSYNMYFTATVGVAVCPDDASDTGALLSHAESALRHAKQQRHNSVSLYDGQRGAEQSDESALGQEIADALANKQLALHYQPQVSAQDGRLIGFEALLRWQSPTLGLLPPGRFLEVTEKLGLIVEIGNWVLTTACCQLREWMDAGIDDISIAVNVSSLQLVRPSFVDEVRATLDAWRVPGNRIEIELTDSTLTRNLDRIQQTMAALRELGLQLTLDDFGMGGSSFAALARYPIGKLKIDRSFFRDISTESREAAIARGIIEVGHHLRMKVIAEGVETEAQLGFLRRNHCDQFQGFLFGPPLPASQLDPLLRRRFLLPDAFTATSPDRTLLLLDDEENVLRSLVRLFRRDGYRVITAGNVNDAFEVLATHQVQVILSDQRMSDMSGTEFLGRVREMYPDTVRLLLSGYTDLATITDAINRGSIYRFLTKPWNDEDLREHVRAAFQTYEDRVERNIHG